MNRFTDFFIKRPVFACVVSLLIFLVGLRAFQLLPLQEFPSVEQSVITISTIYPGADAELVKGFITNPLERSIAGADGIDYMSASSADSTSTISAHIKLGYDSQTVFTNIMSKVAEVRGQLPTASQQPVITKGTGRSFASMYISFTSTKMSAEQITEYVRRSVQTSLETVPGVSAANILGGQTFAMRVWINPDKLASYNLTASDVTSALQQNNVQSAAGSTKGGYISYSIKADTGLQTASGFGNIVVKSVHGNLVRLKDVAKVELGSENYDSSVVFDGNKAVFIGIATTPAANPLTVIKDVRAELKRIQPSFPAELHSEVVYDSSSYISAALKEVITTIFEATFIVLLVIYLFLGTVRSVLIPLVTIPLSLIGVAGLMLLFGFSINILTLLAMVLAIGMVVDDSIVVVENCHRHIEQGKKPFEAALVGAREIAVPVIAMTLTLAAVYAPIGFMQGLTGQLFSEFAFTLAGAVIISGVIALTLSPMMCSKLLVSSSSSGPFYNYIQSKLTRLEAWYKRKLIGALKTRKVLLVVAVVLFLSCFAFYATSKHELAPSEDQNAIFMIATAPQYANINYVEKYTTDFAKLFKQYNSMNHYMIINGMGSTNVVIAGMMLKPWDQRDISQQKITADLQRKIAMNPGLSTFVLPANPLPTGGGGIPVQFVLTSTKSYSNLYLLANDLLKKFDNSGMFIFVNSSLRYDKPVVKANVDRDKAAQMGISMQQISSALASALGGNFIDRFDIGGQSYKVIPQLDPAYRYSVDRIKKINLKTPDGKVVALSSLVSFQRTAEPNSLDEFQQLNSVTLQGVPTPGKSMGDVVSYLQGIAKTLPSGISSDFASASRDYIQQGNALLYTFVFALLAIYLVLAAQFESFRDPFIILISVPMSICGALIFLSLGAASVNIYTQIGLLTLVGLISKHGILMVDFANKAQARGLSKTDAIIEAAAVRMRPILMTTLAMVVGVMPLLFASGAQAHCRFDIGLVIATGMSIGTIFTLFVVPAVYTYIGHDYSVRSDAD
jgi:multidrug efflux pump